MSNDKEMSQKDMLFGVVKRICRLSSGIQDTLSSDAVINYDDLGVVETMYDSLQDVESGLEDAILMLRQIEK